MNGSAPSLGRELAAALTSLVEAVTHDLPLSRILRLALFQVSVAMALVLLNGVLNRVMIVEMGVAASLVALVVALPVLFAPVRILIGHRSDEHRSFLGWRRIPYMWLGTMLQFGGLAILPFSLLVLADPTVGPAWAGPVATGFAFLMVGAGLHTTQTSGLALATDICADKSRPQVVALLYLCLLIGTVAASLAFAYLLQPFSPIRLIQVIQGAAVVTIVLNVIALWRQEHRDPRLTRHDRVRTSLPQAWQALSARVPHGARLLVVVGLGSAAFAMQDVLLEPYGGELFKLPVGQTTLLPGVLALGTLVALGGAALLLQRGSNEFRLAAAGLLIGVAGFSLVIFAAPVQSVAVLVSGVFVVGLGAGLFAISTLYAVMQTASSETAGLALGLWGGVQASAIGIGIAAGGFLRDAFCGACDALGTANALGYSIVFHLEILVLFATLVVVGPLVRSGTRMTGRFGLMDLPG